MHGPFFVATKVDEEMADLIQGFRISGSRAQGTFRALEVLGLGVQLRASKTVSVELRLLDAFGFLMI